MRDRNYDISDEMINLWIEDGNSGRSIATMAEGRRWKAKAVLALLTLKEERERDAIRETAIGNMVAILNKWQFDCQCHLSTGDCPQCQLMDALTIVKEG